MNKKIKKNMYLKVNTLDNFLVNLISKSLLSRVKYYGFLITNPFFKLFKEISPNI